MGEKGNRAKIIQGLFKANEQKNYYLLVARILLLSDERIRLGEDVSTFQKNKNHKIG